MTDSRLWPRSFAQTLAPADGAKTTFHVAGWLGCTWRPLSSLQAAANPARAVLSAGSFFQRAADVAAAMRVLYPDRVDVAAHEFQDRDAFREWLDDSRAAVAEHLGADAAAHSSSPFVWTTAPARFVGGCDALLEALRAPELWAPAPAPTPKRNQLKPLTAEEEAAAYDYDLVVIGGGSGGLACSKEAAKFGQKVCVLDYVKPSPAGTSWGLGGTCVNVGCIPKKLMHQSALLGELMHKDAPAFGWQFDGGKPAFSWEQLVASVNSYIKGLNFKYKVDLRDKKVKYENFLGSFVDAHTLELWHPKKGTKQITARRVVIAVGGRPRALTCPGGELAISSDDIFWRKTAPGKTLVVGASYVALECAGFLKGQGYDVKIMVRSILLRGFDQDMANKIGEYMETESGIEFIRGTVPESITKLDSGLLLVSWKVDNVVVEEEFDTVLNATGRNPDVEKLNLGNAGVTLNRRSGRVKVNKQEQTSAASVFALGDVIDAPELTPVAIQAGRLLARRLYNGESTLMDYDNVCTAVFTPIEYGCCGLSEEDALMRFGDDNIEVYHQNFSPLEWSLSDETRPGLSSGYVKVVCDKTRDNYVIGFHYLGPNAGEVTQAIGLSMKLGFTYDQMVSVVGIHPTTAETFTTLEVTKSSGKDAAAGGC